MPELNKKVTLIIFVLFSFSYILNADDNIHHAAIIKQYKDEENNLNIGFDKFLLYKNQLGEDTLAVFEMNKSEILGYDVNILNQSPLRFLVEIIDETVKDTTIISTGWIDKKYLCVWNWTWDDKGSPYERLYSIPNEYSDFIIVPAAEGPMNVIDYDEKTAFIRVSYKVANKIYTGWINKYCPQFKAGCN